MPPPWRGWRNITPASKVCQGASDPPFVTILVALPPAPSLTVRGATSRFQFPHSSAILTSACPFTRLDVPVWDSSRKTPDAMLSPIFRRRRLPAVDPVYRPSENQFTKRALNRFAGSIFFKNNSIKASSPHDAPRIGSPRHLEVRLLSSMMPLAFRPSGKVTMLLENGV